MALADSCESDGHGNVHTRSTVALLTRFTVSMTSGIAGKPLRAASAPRDLNGDMAVFTAAQHGRQHSTICWKNAEQGTEE